MIEVLLKYLKDEPDMFEGKKGAELRDYYISRIPEKHRVSAFKGHPDLIRTMWP